MNNFPNWADHIVAFIFCILIPLQAIRQNLRNNSAVEYNSRQKQTVYYSTCFSLFIMAAIIVSVWLLFKRPLSAIGFTVSTDGRLWIWTVIVFVLVYAIDTISSVATSKNISASMRDWQKRTPFMPTETKELRAYLLLCLCAGVFEETVYRGYLVTYFEHLCRGSAYQQTLPVILPAFVFSISHFYQGVKSMLKIFILSAFLGFIFIQSGSLVIVMALHFIINVIGGLLTVRYMRKNNELLLLIVLTGFF
jgi:membrane protease YdiL (CAAX protease family)